MATVILLLFGIGSAIGIIGGGALGQLVYNRRKEWMPVLAGLCVMAGIGPLYFLVNADLQVAGLGAAMAMSALAGIVSSVAAPNLRAAMLNVNGGPLGEGGAWF
jgi:hypothetical protein